MNRNLVICCDGTNNQFGPENTNVVRLVQALDRDPGRQRLYYDPGVGTLPEPGRVTAAAKLASGWAGLALGVGLPGKVEQAYRYLMDAWEPGDRVFLFGFSRGAYTVRVLAALLHALGLLPRGNHNLTPYLMRLFSASRDAKREDQGGDSNYWKLSNQFRSTFARAVPGAAKDDRRFPVHFLGCWDTVASVGWVYNPRSYPYTRRNPSVAVVRHALALDERRWFFRQNEFRRAGGQDLVQAWFPGVHADVGGGYPERDGGLWREPFGWMAAEAQAHGLHLDPARLHAVLSRSPIPDEPWAEPMHESLTAAWRPFEYVPKFAWDWKTKRERLGLGRGRYRTLVYEDRPDEEVMIHASALRRIRAGGYAPAILADSFLDEVRALPDVPDLRPYRP
ncbi:T6SS phospholipase effector Tle1-like catalytic domain-containing protein [Paludisphaera mucosa]|uniref:DUF2235 domain-containing protein n=1 Tax=Paludisphaera mucosa TaxID=3030827 RepID=A0ABT6FJF6_9BACT|nr:DUF2235 domain-containing protein [Paludisphaera mucosa]MDG3007634.1 DUF2235 domain-containing protein [Paludisphaera mucosa]